MFLDHNKASLNGVELRERDQQEVRQTEGLMGNRLMYSGISQQSFLSICFTLSSLLNSQSVTESERQQEQGAPYQWPAVSAEGRNTPGCICNTGDSTKREGSPAASSDLSASASPAPQQRLKLFHDIQAFLSGFPTFGQSLLALLWF